MTIQNQNSQKVRIEKSLIPVVMLLILAAAVLLLIPVAVTSIPAVAVSILAAVNNTLFFLKGPGYVSVLFLEAISKKSFVPISALGPNLNSSKYYSMSAG